MAKKNEDERTQRAKALGAKFAVHIEEDDKIIFLKEPGREVYVAWVAGSENDPMSANETVIRTLAIKEVSDMEVLNDYKALGAVMKQLGGIMALKKSSLKTL